MIYGGNGNVLTAANSSILSGSSQTTIASDNTALAQNLQNSGSRIVKTSAFTTVLPGGDTYNLVYGVDHVVRYFTTGSTAATATFVIPTSPAFPVGSVITIRILATSPSPIPVVIVVPLTNAFTARTTLIPAGAPANRALALGNLIAFTFVQTALNEWVTISEMS